MGGGFRDYLGEASGLRQAFRNAETHNLHNALLRGIVQQDPGVRQGLYFDPQQARDAGVTVAPMPQPVPPGGVMRGPGAGVYQRRLLDMQSRGMIPPGATQVPSPQPNVVMTQQQAELLKTLAQGNQANAFGQYLGGAGAGGAGGGDPGMMRLRHTVGPRGPTDMYGYPDPMEVSPESPLAQGAPLPAPGAQGQRIAPAPQAQAQPQQEADQGYAPPAYPGQVPQPRAGGGSQIGPASATAPTRIAPAAQAQPSASPSPAALADPELASAFNTLGIKPTGQAPAGVAPATPAAQAPVAAPPAQAPPPLPEQQPGQRMPEALGGAAQGAQPGTPTPQGVPTPAPHVVGNKLISPKVTPLTDEEQALQRVAARDPSVAAKIQQAGGLTTAMRAYPELADAVNQELIDTKGRTTEATGRATAKVAQLSNDDRAFLRGVQESGRIIQQIYQEFPDPMERDKFIGALQNPVQRGKQLVRSATGGRIGGAVDPRFERFSSLIGRIEHTKFTEGGKQLTGIEQRIVNSYIPTGREGGGVTAFDNKARAFFDGIGPQIGEWAKTRGAGDEVVNQFLSEWGVPQQQQR